MLTREEILKTLTDNFKEVLDLEDLQWGHKKNGLTTEDGIVIKCVEQVGGEGEGDHYHIVTSLTKDNKTTLIKHVGFYSSYVGVEFDGLDSFDIVEKKEKTITVYE